LVCFRYDIVPIISITWMRYRTYNGNATPRVILESKTMHQLLNRIRQHYQNNEAAASLVSKITTILNSLPDYLSTRRGLPAWTNLTSWGSLRPKHSRRADSLCYGCLHRGRRKGTAVEDAPE
jgi:hypothetical protein